MNADIIVYLEHDGKRLHGEMANLASKASALAKTMGGRAVGALVGEIGDALRDEARGLNCHEVVVVNHPELREYHSQLYGAALQSVIEAMTPHAVLFRHSFIGIELAPALAYRLRGAIISNCLDLEVREGRICALRAYLKETCWGRLSARGSSPYFFTVQKFPLPGDGPLSPKPAAIKEWTFTPPTRIRIRSKGITRRIESVDISQAEIIVSVGRGIKDKANIKIVEELADALGASVGCSRPIADLGWLPVERQVGLSGKTVRPKVYLACGISGESQHLAGMRDSSLIIAINTDPAAPIFRIAHYGVVAELVKFLPVLTAAAVKEKQT